MVKQTVTKTVKPAAAKAVKPAATKAAKKPAAVKVAKQQRVLKEITENLITPEERLQMISEAAYYIAEQHDFDPARSELNWVQAERQVDSLLLSDGNKSSN